VRPGVFDVRARPLWPTSALISDDLPTFERPFRRQEFHRRHAANEDPRAPEKRLVVFYRLFCHAASVFRFNWLTGFGVLPPKVKF
jgi:hypothetical protein